MRQRDALLFGLISFLYGYKKVALICDFFRIFSFYIAATFFVKRDILRAARFLGIILPADFIILLSAARVALIAVALSPDAIADKTFLVAVLTALRRDVFIAFFFAVTKILFFDDL